MQTLSNELADMHLEDDLLSQEENLEISENIGVPNFQDEDEEEEEKKESGPSVEQLQAEIRKIDIGIRTETDKTKIIKLHERKEAVLVTMLQEKPKEELQKIKSEKKKGK